MSRRGSTGIVGGDRYKCTVANVIEFLFQTVNSWYCAVAGNALHVLAFSKIQFVQNILGQGVEVLDEVSVGTFVGQIHCAALACTLDNSSESDMFDFQIAYLGSGLGFNAVDIETILVSGSRLHFIKNLGLV